MDGREVIRRLEREGWDLDRTSGSHHIFVHPERANHVTVPHPLRDIPVGTLRNIYRQARWQWR